MIEAPVIEDVVEAKNLEADFEEVKDDSDNEEEGETIEAEIFDFNGISYLKDENNNVYDMEQNNIGIFNEETNTIDFI